MKRCTKCKIEKQFSEFHRRSSNPDGQQRQCKACIRTGRVKGYYANREANIARSVKWTSENRARFNATQRKNAKKPANRQKHKEKIRRQKRNLATSYLRSNAKQQGRTVNESRTSILIHRTKRTFQLLKLLNQYGS